MTTSLQTPFRRVALVTGVGRQRGIGAGVARALASRGWDLALNHWAAYDRRMPWGRTVDETAEIAAELRTHGVRVVSIEADLESASSASQIFQVASSDLGSSQRLSYVIASRLLPEFSKLRWRALIGTLQ